MKSKFFLFLLFTALIMSCNQQKKSPIDGAWKLVFANYPSMNASYPDQITGSGVKFWTEGCFTFSGRYQMDTLTVDNYGWGTYKLTDGTKYEETISRHNYDPEMEGQTIKMLIEIRNDTLVQMWPADDNWKLAENYSAEKYIRYK